MKKHFKTIALISFLLISQMSNAQAVFVSKIGYNAAKMLFIDTDDVTEFNTNPILKFRVGGSAQIPISKKCILEPGLFYSGKGFGLKAGTRTTTALGTGIDMRMAIEYLEIPINLMVKFNDQCPVSLMAFFGPYVGVALLGKTKITTTTNSNSRYSSTKYKSKSTDISDLSIGSSTSDDVRLLDFGIQAGLAIVFNKLEIDLQSSQGFTSITPGGGARSFLNQVFSLTLGYRYGGETKGRR